MRKINIFEYLENYLSEKLDKDKIFNKRFNDCFEYADRLYQDGRITLDENDEIREGAYQLQELILKTIAECPQIAIILTQNNSQNLVVLNEKDGAQC